MNKTEKIALTMLGLAVVGVVVFSMRGGVPGVLESDILSQSPVDANTDGPAYLVARMPYGYGPPVTMQAPVTSQGIVGQRAPLYGNSDDCGCA